MLFLREVKKVVVSIPWLVFVAAVTIGLYSQGVFHFDVDLVSEPQPGENYGMKSAEIPEVIMPEALAKLWEEFCENDYVTYPIGFIKHVKLSESEQAQMAAILSEITGTNADVLLSEGMAGGGLSPEVRGDMDYALFKELMEQADALLGGGSSYEADSLSGYSPVPLTYEEARERYELVLGSDHITGGYARLFCDYAGVMTLSVLPVFLAVILCMKDRSAKMEELIYAREASSLRIITARYLALLTAVMLPVVVLSYLSNAPTWGLYDGMQLDCLAPLKYDLGWLLPSVMTATAVGMFLTELTGTPVAVAVQGLWWLLDLNAGIKSVHAGYALFRLAPRHNSGALSWFRTQDYLDYFEKLAENRLLFAGMSLLLTAFTVLIYEAKRGGRFDAVRWFKGAFSGLGNRKNQSAA